MIIKYCLVCNNTFEVISSHAGKRKTCSHKCGGIYRSIHIRDENHPRWKGGKIEKNCLWCNAGFQIWPSQKNKNFCSLNCKKKYNVKKNSKHCQQCNKIFNSNPSSNRKFCCKKCAWEYNSTHIIGKNHHNWKSRIKKVCPICREVFLVPQCRGKIAICCSTICQYKYISIHYRGENASNWQGGKKIYFRTEYKSWIKSIFRRDNYECQLCGDKNQYKKPLDAHHIYPKCDYPELVYYKDNGITLCRRCHRYFTKQEIHFIDFFERIRDYNETFK